MALLSDTHASATPARIFLIRSRAASDGERYLPSARIQINTVVTTELMLRSNRVVTPFISCEMVVIIEIGLARLGELPGSSGDPV